MLRDGQWARLWWGTNAHGPRCFVSTVGSCVDGVFCSHAEKRHAGFSFEKASSGFFCMLTSLPGEARW